MADKVSSYLLTPPRLLPAACRQVDKRWQSQSNPCKACSIAEICAAADAPAPEVNPTAKAR